MNAILCINELKECAIAPLSVYIVRVTKILSHLSLCVHAERRWYRPQSEIYGKKNAVKRVWINRSNFADGPVTWQPNPFNFLFPDAGGTAFCYKMTIERQRVSQIHTRSTLRSHSLTRSSTIALLSLEPYECGGDGGERADTAHAKLSAHNAHHKICTHGDFFRQRNLLESHSERYDSKRINFCVRAPVCIYIL